MKMKTPRLFDEVLDAVATVKNPKGPTYEHIVHEIQMILRRKNIRLKKVYELVKEAVIFGTKSSLLKKKDGHYQLRLSKEDYQVYKKFRFGDGNLTTKESFKSSEQKSKRKRSKSRSETSESEADSESATASSRSSRSNTSGKY